MYSNCTDWYRSNRELLGVDEFQSLPGVTLALKLLTTSKTETELHRAPIYFILGCDPQAGTEAEIICWQWGIKNEAPFYKLVVIRPNDGKETAAIFEAELPLISGAIVQVKTKAALTMLSNGSFRKMEDNRVPSLPLWLTKAHLRDVYQHGTRLMEDYNEAMQVASNEKPPSTADKVSGTSADIPDSVT